MSHHPSTIRLCPSALPGLLAAAMLCALLGACGGEEANASGSGARPAPEGLAEQQLCAPEPGAPIATLSTTMGDVSFVLYPEYAPMAVENFVGLARQGYYDGLPFHRVIEGFLIQTGAGAQGDSDIWNGNAFPNEISDRLHHYAGAVAMACAAEDAAGNLSQFYIVQSPPDSVDAAAAKALTQAGLRDSVVAAYRAVGGVPYLDNLDTVFGQVYEGMDVVDAIAAAECGDDNRPSEDILVLRVTIGSYAASEPPADDASSGAAQ